MLSVQAQLTILKPIERVFGAALDPRPFFVQHSSGILEEGKTISWEFEEFPTSFPVEVEKVIPNELIHLKWKNNRDQMNDVQIEFSKFDAHATTVTITESGWADDDLGRASSYRNSVGWMHYLCSLKAHLEYGVNLRKGSFAHMKGKVGA